MDPTSPERLHLAQETAAARSKPLPRLTPPAAWRRLWIQSETDRDLLNHRPLEHGGDDLDFAATAIQVGHLIAAGWNRASSACDRCSATNRPSRAPGLGRPLPTADVGFPVAQLGCQLSGGEIARPTGASRPKPEGQASPKLPDNRTKHLRALRLRSQSFMASRMIGQGAGAGDEQLPGDPVIDVAVVYLSRTTRGV